MDDPERDPLLREVEDEPEAEPRRGWRRHHRLGSRIRIKRAPGSRVPPSFYIFPNLFTSASLFLALYSITKSAEGIVLSVSSSGEPQQSFVAACWAILLAAVCDAIDGPVARLTRTSSSFGLQYDSLADVVAFGVAPAFLMFSNLRTMDQALLPDYAPKLAMGAAALYAICAAIRLARFNVQAATTEKKFFSGLPSPGAAGAVVTAYLFVEWFSGLSAIRDIDDPARVARILHRCVLLLMVALALLMVSEVPFPKLRNMIRITRKPLNTLVIFIAIACVMIALSHLIPVFLFGGFLLYIISALVTGVRHRFRRPIEEAQVPL